MLAAPTTPPSKVGAVSNDTKNNRYQPKSFDAFDSPFHTPSLFGNTSNTTTAVKATIKNHDFNSKYEQYYYKDDYRLFHHNNNNPVHSSSPESFFSVMADLESSGTRTPSPKNDYCYDTRDDLFKVEPPPPPFLYNHQRKAEPTAIISYTNQQQDQLLYPADNSFGLFMNHEYQQYYNDQYSSIDRLSNDALRQQLKESAETIHKLVKQLQITKIEADKKQVMCTNIQSSLTAKDVEFQEQEQKLLMATQFVEAQALKMDAMQTELTMYQSFIKSKGLELPVISGEMAVALESSEIKLNRLCKLREHPEASKSMETTSVVRNSDSDVYYSTGRRWSEEKSSQNMMMSNFNSSATTGEIVTAERKPNNGPVDYNRMLDKSVNVNWDSLVDRIIKETDQKASLFLQNKFKCATLDQKQLMFESILMQAYNLMTNRFGNFLVQRLLELGTTEQIQSLVDTMKGHILELTCEPFGCHVVQKALDNVDEPVKASLVSELFVSIPETITHKYACHVWQKVFEIKWEHHPPPIMEYVHEALKGKWAQVALDETGSLVIQNIFENLTESDKRPVLDEVLKNTVSIAKGQWGNWVIQHILEHAEKSKDRETAFQIVIEEGVQLSTDQFASKVVEKALRIGGEQFMTEFIKRISTNHTNHRPRVALIDIASDQYGNYVVQWLINNACEDQKVYICRLIKRHMVSLRSSKYGQRVAFLVEKVLRNNEITTYPPAAATSSSSSILKNY